MRLRLLGKEKKMILKKLVNSHVCCCIPAVEMSKAGGSCVQFFSKFRDSLGHMRPYFKKPGRVYNEVSQGSLLWSFLGLQVQDVSS